MITLILLVLFGGFVAFFATQNTGGVSLYFNDLVLANVPLYLVVLGSMLLGIAMAFIISLVNDLAHGISLFSKDRALAAKNSALRDYANRIHDLELENERLRADHHVPLTTQVKDRLHRIAS